MTQKTPPPFDFEKALSQLETLIQKMESETLSLEESLKYFEEGVVLTKTCQKALAEAEQKVKIITQQQMKNEQP